MLTVSSDVAFDLSNPVSRIVPSLKLNLPSRPVSTMPKISIHKYNDPRSSKDKVWLARKINTVLSVPDPSFP